MPLNGKTTLLNKDLDQYACSTYHLFVTPKINHMTLGRGSNPSLGKQWLKSEYIHVIWRACALTVCVVDSGIIPSLLMVSLKVYSTPASSSEPEIPNIGPWGPRPKFRLEQCSGPCQEELGHNVSRILLMKIGTFT